MSQFYFLTKVTAHIFVAPTIGWTLRFITGPLAVCVLEAGCISHIISEHVAIRLSFFQIPKCPFLRTA